MIAIVCSRADEASKHVVEHVLSEGSFEQFVDDSRPEADGGGTCYRSADFEVRSFDDLHLQLESVADAFDDPEYLLFASRHAGDTGALLSAHVTGNFGPAEYGGRDGALAMAPPNALAAVLERLEEHAPAGYDVGLECTHHGPSSVGVPSMFVELGSGPDEWTDPAGARAVARAILDLGSPGAPREAGDGRIEPVVEPADTPSGHVEPYAPPENGGRRHFVGIGGGHYAPRYARIVRETDWAVGHVAADWCLDAMGDPDSTVLEAAFERSVAQFAVVDGDHPDVVAAIEDLGYRVVSETWVRETTGVPLSLVETAEATLGSVDEGLRFGAPARNTGIDSCARPETEGDAGNRESESERTHREAARTLAAITLPAELRSAVQGVDREAALDAVDRHCIAYDTEESGTRLGNQVLVPSEPGTAPHSDDPLEDLVDRFLTILRAGYDEARLEDGVIVAERTTFDPALAAAAGVPEGPAFGRLADGETVTVDGETIDPTDVTSQTVDRFALPSRGSR